MSGEQLRPHLKFARFEAVRELLGRHPDRSMIVALGHFGNFELFTRAVAEFPGTQLATTYRGLRQEAATRVVIGLRERSGCLFFERRRDAARLREALRTRRLALGLLADQHDGRGVWVPFLGRDAGTSTAPALLALRYGCPLVTAFCFRTGLARWRLEYGDEIPTRKDDGTRRALVDIARDMNASFERAVRRDPANWFWVHRRWKPARGSGAP
jgi:KDO2-lipid IV(A) lauroyltransferase